VNAVVEAPSHAFGWALIVTAPEPIPQFSPRIRLIRAALGLACLLSLMVAAVSLVWLVALADPRAGFAFGVSGIVLWLAIRIGGKYRPPTLRGNWGTLVQANRP
jgi:hypothetical protein